MMLLDGANLHKSYGSVQVLKGVSIGVEEGETVAVLGPNGAGKTTLFRVLSGEIRADAGTITFAGRDVTRLAEYHRVRRGVGRTFQNARIFPDLTVVENMMVAVERRRATAGEPLDRWWRRSPSAAVNREALDGLAALGLAAYQDRLARWLSLGDKKRLELGLALMLKPRILMLDEPTAGMAPGDRMAAVELLRTLKQQHRMTLLLTEHDMEVVFGLATRLIVLNYGEVIAAGDPQAVRDNPRVREVYLGQGGHHA